MTAPLSKRSAADSMRVRLRARLRILAHGNIPHNATLDGPLHARQASTLLFRVAIQLGGLIHQRRAASAVHGSAFERLSPRQALPRIATLCGFADVSASYAHTVCLWSTARLLRVHTWYL